MVQQLHGLRNTTKNGQTNSGNSHFIGPASMRKVGISSSRSWRALLRLAFAFVKDSEEISTRWKIHYIEDKELEGASIEKIAA